MHYLHLAVRGKGNGKPIEHLIFADVSGEQFRIIRDSEAEMLKFNVLKRADYIFYVVNGEHLIDLDTRQKTKFNSVRLIQRAIENKMLSDTVPFEVVISKLDKIQGHIDSVNSFFVTDLKSKFPDHLKGFSYVASRSVTHGIGAGQGIDELLNKILESKREEKVSVVGNDLKREFHKSNATL